MSHASEALQSLFARRLPPTLSLLVGGGVLVMLAAGCAPAAGGSGAVDAAGTGTGGSGGSLPATGGTPGVVVGTGGSGGDTSPTGTGGGAPGSGGASDGNGSGGSAASTRGGTAGTSASGGGGGSGGIRAVGSGGMVVVGGTGGGGGGTKAGMCPAGALLCEGFESYAADATPGGTWTPDLRGAGAVKVETGRPFAGAKAIHITGTMNTDRANIIMPLPIAADTVFLRFMMYTASYPSSSGVHTRLIRLGTTTAETGDPYTSYSFSSFNGTAIEKVNSIYQRDTGTHLNDSNVKNRWVCWEFEIDKRGGAGKVAPHIWLDGKELSLAVAGSATHGMTTATWDPIDFQELIVGLDGFQADTVKADFWIDELVVNAARIGCPTN